MNSLASFLAKIIPPHYQKLLAPRGELSKIVSNAGWLITDTVIQIITNLVVGIWLSRYLGPELRGIDYYANSFVGLFVPISALGLGEILIREIVRKPEMKAELLGTAFVVQTVSYLLMLPIILISAWVLRPGEALVHWSVVIVAIGSIFLNSRIFNWWFASQLQSKYTVWATRLAEITVALSKILLLLFKASFLAFITIDVLKYLLYFVFKAYYYQKVGEKMRAWRFNKNKVKALLRDSWPLAFTFLSISVYSRVNSIMLGQMLSNNAVGIYGEADNLSSLWYFIPGAIASSVYPVLVRNRQNASATKYNQLVQIFLDALVVMSYVIIIPATIVAPPMMRLLYGEAFAASGKVLSILIWSLLFISLKQAQDFWLMTENQTKYTILSTVIGVVLVIGFNFFLIPRYGEIGAAWSTVASLGISIYLTALIFPTIRPLFRLMLKALFSPLRLYSISTAFTKIIH